MTSKEIQKYYEILQSKKKEIRENSSYAYGKNYKIYSGEAKPKPDNRIAVPLGKSAITDIAGYAGRPGEIKTEYIKTGDDNGDEVTALLDLFDQHNREGIENSELLTVSLSLGEAWELWYTSDDLELPGAMRTPEYIRVQNHECVAVWTRDLKPKLEMFMRFSTDDEKAEHCDVYYPRFSESWIKTQDTWQRNEAEDTIYPYTTVPAVRFRTSMENVPVFEAQKPIMDGLDDLVSNTQNEVDRFAALALLFPEKVDKPLLKKILESIQPYFDDLEAIEADKWPRYLEKNLSGVQEFYQAQADRLERLFHKTIKVPDMSDKEFAGDQSGVAIAYKLIGFEFLVSEIEIYFRQGLERRYELYKDIFNDSTMTVNWDDYEQVITWNRNLPVDDEAKVRIAAMLQGLGFDMKIIVKYLPATVTHGMSVEEIKEMLDGADPEAVNPNEP